MLATHNPPVAPDRVPDSVRRVKRRQARGHEALPDTALDPTRLARQTAITSGLTPQTPLTPTASFIETNSDSANVEARAVGSHEGG